MQIQRTEERITLSLPINLEGGAAGVTRDISASGIYFETDLKQTVGSMIDFALDFDNHGMGMTLNCHGQIVRVEEHEKHRGLAVRIIEAKLRVIRR
ncbi:MAG: PilZ domain-containing protein [Planctomycetota bacterium]